MRIAFIAALSVIAAPAFANAAEDWVEIARTDTGGIIYVDNGSLQRSGNVVQGVEKWDHRNDTDAKHRMIVIRAAYDCRARSYRIKSADFTDVDGQPPETYNWTEAESTFQPIEKGSIAESILDHVCARTQ